MGASQVTGRTTGPAIVGIDCTYIGCVRRVEMTLTDTPIRMSCDLRKGVDGILHTNPLVTVNIEADDYTLANIARSYDSVVTTWGGTETNTLEQVPVVFSGSAGDWSGTVDLNGEISGTVLFFSDAAGSTAWVATINSGTATVTGACLGTVALTSSGTATPPATLYATYAWGDQITSGSSRVAPSFAANAPDHPVVIIHKLAQSNELEIIRLWRTQVVRNTTRVFDNSVDDTLTIPIQLEGLVDTIGHPGNPIFDESRVSLVGYDPDYSPYNEAVSQNPIT